MNLKIALIGYAGAAAAFAILTVLLLSVWRERARGSLLTVACFVTMLWALSLAEASLRVDVTTIRVFLTEIIHDSVWLFCLSSLLGGAVATAPNWLVRRGGAVLGIALLIAGVGLAASGLDARFPGALSQLLVLGSIGTSLYALVGVEQLYRNARPTQQNALKFLCLGLAGIFAYDLFLYSNVVVDGQIRTAFWGARGYVTALCVPLLAVSIRRIPSWHRGIFASRQVVFYTTTLVAAGVYLTLIGFAGYYIQSLGREWGDALQLIFISAAIIGFIALAMSEQLRARIRVWLVKHFFERKYDYREEWLRLIHTLTSTEDGLPLKKRAIRSLAQVIDSPSGHLWLTNHTTGTLESVSSWNTPPVEEALASDSSLVRHMVEQGWIIDVRELSEHPKKYEPLSISDLTESLSRAGFILPLLHEGDLLGFVAVSPAKTPLTLNFEDHDLLKTAGQQVASYLAQEAATEQLAENRQFEAYNRFTAFVMHDLKNAIAQQSLVVENAERHKRNPDFVDDAIDTIKGSVTRMRRVLSQLRQGSTDPSTERVDLTKLMLEAQSQCADRMPVPETKLPSGPIVIQANRERLLSALLHAVRNAQDATPADGAVNIDVEVSDSVCRLCIADNGSGMDEPFIREHLFRPFDSTKGAEGMGIGAYQIRETIRACGGDVEVRSRLGEGTTFILTLPILEAAAE